MTLYVITGPPAAGKTTWVKDHTTKYAAIAAKYARADW